MTTTTRPTGPRPLACYRATTLRILKQLRADHRTVAMLLLVPALLLTLLYFVYQNSPTPPERRGCSTGSASACSASCRSSSCS